MKRSWDTDFFNNFATFCSARPMGKPFQVGRLKGNRVQIPDSPAAVNSLCGLFQTSSHFLIYNNKVGRPTSRSKSEDLQNVVMPESPWDGRKVS